ncbi:hypothetical protein NDU88_000328 [Pleurodeles waltl]|uniref:Uncharacterized protein n=1 Tax=Pleurodeles waltl TaxID=8319 RepID=A0AAV7KNM9_PLEWA|nr:hypothetical protein NDU88_000328 [Pleurodeles waltl]
MRSAQGGSTSLRGEIRSQPGTQQRRAPPPCIPPSLHPSQPPTLTSPASVDGRETRAKIETKTEKKGRVRKMLLSHGDISGRWTRGGRPGDRSSRHPPARPGSADDGGPRRQARAAEPGSESGIANLHRGPAPPQPLIPVADTAATRGKQSRQIRSSTSPGNYKCIFFSVTITTESLLQNEK